MECFGRCKTPCVGCLNISGDGETIRRTTQIPGQQGGSHRGETESPEQRTQPSHGPEAAARASRGGRTRVPGPAAAEVLTGGPPQPTGHISRIRRDSPSRAAAVATSLTQSPPRLAGAAAGSGKSTVGTSSKGGSSHARNADAAERSAGGSPHARGSPRAGDPSRPTAQAIHSSPQSASHAAGSPLAERAGARSSTRPVSAPKTHAAAVPSTNLSRTSPTPPGSSEKGSRRERTTAGPFASANRSTSRLVKIGITTELSLGTANKGRSHKKIEGFAEILADIYNETVHPTYPKMQLDLRELSEDEVTLRQDATALSTADAIRRREVRRDYTRWCMLNSGIYPYKKPAPQWSIELISPIFRASFRSTWRTKVEATWAYLLESYVVTGTSDMGTHIHISMEPAYTLKELKQIAQAVIHFEPSIEALVPESRRRNRFAKSNWLDNPSLGHRNLSRADSIAKIGTLQSAEELIECMGEKFDRNYCWNFESLRDRHKPTIEFRKPPVDHRPHPNQVLGWTEIVLLFVQAAIKCKSPEQLQEVPATVGGLRWFLRQGDVPGVTEPWRLVDIFGIKDSRWTAQPTPQPEAFLVFPEEVQELRVRLQKMAVEDHRKILSLAEEKEEPYWR